MAALNVKFAVTCLLVEKLFWHMDMLFWRIRYGRLFKYSRTCTLRSLTRLV